MYVAASCPWDLGCGTRGVARPPAWQTFFRARKNIFQNIFDRMDSIYRAWHSFGKNFFWRASGTGPVEPQGHDLCLWHVCTLYITTHMSTCTVGTCRLCPAMSVGESKNYIFLNERVQNCKNALLRFQKSKNEISKRVFRSQSAKPNFQVPLKTRVHRQAYINMTKP